MKVVLIEELDKPNKNGRVYGTELMEHALKNQEQRIASGYMMGGLSPGVINSRGRVEDIATDYPNINLKFVSHIVQKMWIENGQLLGEIKVLETPHGEILQEMVDKKEVEFRTLGTGLVSKEGVVSDYNLISIAAVRKGSAA